MSTKRDPARERARRGNRNVAAVLFAVFSVMLVLSCYHHAWGPTILLAGFALLSLSQLRRYL